MARYVGDEYADVPRAIARGMLLKTFPSTIDLEDIEINEEAFDTTGKAIDWACARGAQKIDSDSSCPINCVMEGLLRFQNP